MTKRSPRTARAESVLFCLAVLIAAGALAGGCGSAGEATVRGPVARKPTGPEACRACARTSCGAEFSACKADTAPTNGPGEAYEKQQCPCAGLFSSHPGASYADTVAACGQSALYDALAACVEARCADTCDKENVDT
jgi:hypothetical protein